MSSKITLGAAFGLLLGVGVWNALRPGAAESEAPALAAERLASIPMRIGPWIGSDTEVNLKAMRVAEAEAYLSRTYVHERTRARYSVMVLYGSPGGLGAHDPQTCYAGTGFEPVGPAAKRNLPDPPAELWSARFERTTPAREALEVFWGWGTRGEWRAPVRPRLAFAGEGRIYKLYAQRPVPAEAPEADPWPPPEGFLEPFLQEVKAALTRPGR